jgi:hypothetical protein
MNSMKSSTILGITLFMLVISYAWFSMLQDWLIHFICMKIIIMPNGFWFSSLILVLFCMLQVLEFLGKWRVITTFKSYHSLRGPFKMVVMVI